MRGPGAIKIAEPMVPPADVSAMVREQAEILHDEIAGLPGSFRVPVVLCYFEGLTLDEAAHRLQCPVGTIRSRLARAKGQAPPTASPAAVWSCPPPHWPLD